MSQTAPPDRDLTSGDDHRDADATPESNGRDWKQAVVAVTSTVADAAVDAVAIVGDAARSLTPKQRPDQDNSGNDRSTPGARTGRGSRPRRSASPASGNGGPASAPVNNARTRRRGESPQTGGAAAVPKTAGRRGSDTASPPAPDNTEQRGSDTASPPAPDNTEQRGSDTASPPPPDSTEQRRSDTDAAPADPVGGRNAAGTTNGQPRSSPRSRSGVQQRSRRSGSPSTNGVPAPARAPTAAAAAVPVLDPADVGPQTTGRQHPDGGTRETTAWLPPLRRRVERERPWLMRAAAFAAVSLAGLAAIIVASVALLPRAVAYATNAADAELILPQDAAFDPLAQRSRVLYTDGSLLAILHGEEDRNPVRLSKMPDHAWQAIVAAEDRKFFEHKGYDPAGIGRALLANFQAGGVKQGGSTISQQVARMNFKEVGLEQSVERKVKEVAYAVALEERFSKKDILDRYVNQVYFGAGAYGLQAASEEFFDTNVIKIAPDEAALLAGLISSPSAYNPRANPESAKEQRDLVLGSMAEEGYLTNAEAAEYIAKPLDIAPPSRGTNKQPAVLEEIMREFKANPLFGATIQEREDNLFNGGLRITTTIRPRLQRLAQQTVENNFSGSGPTAAIGVIDPRSGEIRAAASSKKFNRDNFNLALRGRRQPGSAFKPFVMAEALRQGFSPGTTLNGKSPIVLPQRYGPDWQVSNYGGASYGQVDMATATKKSINTYYAQLIQLVGVEKAVSMAEELGISRAGIGEPGFYGPAIVLGGLRNGATPVEMASAYGTFANNGVHVEPFLISSVKRGKKDLFEREPRKKQILKPAVNAAALRMLQGPPSSGGTAPIAQMPGWPVAGKTGTTQKATDAWFVGTTPVLSTAVWVGYPKGQVRMYGATGGGTAAPIWKQFMSEALSGRDPKSFPSVDEAEFVGKTVNVPSLVGLSEQDALAKLAKRKLIGRAQMQASAAAAGSVIWASPSDKAQVGTTVYIGVSTGVPPPPPKPEKPPKDESKKSDKPKNDGGRNNQGGGGGASEN